MSAAAVTFGNKKTTVQEPARNWNVRMFGTHLYYQGDHADTSEPLWTDKKSDAQLFDMAEAETMCAGLRQARILAVAVSKGGMTIGSAFTVDAEG